MNKKIIAFCIVIIILLNKLFWNKIDYSVFNLPTVIYYSIILVASVFLFRNYKPKSKNKFLTAVILYLLIVFLVSLYLFFR